MSTSKTLIKQTLHLIESWIDYQTYVKEIPGVALGIFVEDAVVLQREYGYASGSPRTQSSSRPRRS